MKSPQGASELSKAAENAADFLRTLAHPARLRVVCALLGGELTAGELADLAGLRAPALSQQASVLEAGGLIRRHAQDPGRTLAMLYFTNSICGALGVLASGFWLIELVGLPGTLRIAGLMNVALGGIVIALVFAEPARPPASAVTTTRGPGLTGRVLFVAAIATEPGEVA